MKDLRIVKFVKERFFDFLTKPKKDSSLYVFVDNKYQKREAEIKIRFKD